MVKLLVMACLLSVGPLVRADARIWLVGEPMWLATNECSFADAAQCAAERAAKEILRNGDIPVADDE